MIVRWSLAAALALAAAAGGAGCSTGGSASDGETASPPPAEPAAKPAPRNPFGVPDVQGPMDDEVRKFAEEAPPLGDPSDPNAEAWATVAAEGDGLDGRWEARWNFGPGGGWAGGTATVRTVGQAIYINYVDYDSYLIEVRREGNRLVGRYRTVVGEESSPWIGTIVSPTRIDGWWGRGRWDLRRAEPTAPVEP